MRTPSRVTKRDWSTMLPSFHELSELGPHRVRLHQLESQALAVKADRAVEVRHAVPSAEKLSDEALGLVMVQLHVCVAG